MTVTIACNVGLVNEHEQSYIFRIMETRDGQSSSINEQE